MAQSRCHRVTDRHPIQSAVTSVATCVSTRAFRCSPGLLYHVTATHTKGSHSNFNWSSSSSGLPSISRRTRCLALADSPSEGELSGDRKLERIVFLPSGDAVSLTSRKRTELWPELAWGRDECLQKQLVALQNNNNPYVDHGIEVMYRFAAFDPFNPRTTYFGTLQYNRPLATFQKPDFLCHQSLPMHVRRKVFDLGQFERFRRIMRTPPYATLLGHQVSENVWVARVAVTGAPHGESAGDYAIFEFTLVQRLGGVHDGYWFTQSLVADGNDWGFMKGGHPHRI